MIFDEIVMAVRTTDLQNLLNPLNQTLLQNRVHANLEKILPNMSWRSPHKFTQERRDELIFTAHSVQKMVRELLSLSSINGVPIRWRRNLYRDLH